MNRTLLLAFGAMLVAGAAHAADYRINTAGKSPEQVRASIANAAAEVCKSAYAGEPLGVYERPSCEREAYKSGVSRYERLRASAPTASTRRAPEGDSVSASR